MVSIAIVCPHCGQAEHVVKHGFNRGGSARCRCLPCDKTFTPAPNSQGLTPEKEAAIVRALCERIPQQGIARMLKVGRDTIRRVRKKGHSA